MTVEVDNNCKHYWREIESDELGRPIKYKCVSCTLIYEIVKNSEPSEYFDKINSLHNRIKENNQKIEFIHLNLVGFNEKIHLEHLEKETTILTRLLNLSQ